MAINTELIKELREKTSAGIMDVKQALEESKGDIVKAEEWLKQKGLASAAKKGDRETGQGIIATYVHNHRIGAMVEVNCETDFVAKTEDFQQLSRDIAMQVAAMGPESVEALLEQEFIKDPSNKISDLVKGAIAKLGENIIVGRIVRYELGQA